ncbi:conserved hypothetical protein [Mesorhizobium plurifarium]|uniref:Uncharacterized protein n=1 Tax=Mesorhizobium plurifarium TaxID=69974 RepID=A0A090EC13_MESPL|nr:conserved hypothetical protein [Mesorhizobium plurifarium]
MFEAHGKDPRVDTDAEVTAHEMAIGYPMLEGFIPLCDTVYSESVVSVSRFAENQLAEVRLYPLELRRAERFANRGVPRLAPTGQARAILERLQMLSKPFGTQIEIENGVGLIRLNSSANRSASNDRCSDSA